LAKFLRIGKLGIYLRFLKVIQVELHQGIIQLSLREISLEKNHTPEFWEIIKAILPDYEERKEWLKINGKYLDI